MPTVNEIQTVVGVDTHVDTHTAVLCDGLGRKVAETTVPTTPDGHVDLLAWARHAAGGSEVTWAIEGCRHYGLGLTRFLHEHNQHVVDIDKSRRQERPDRCRPCGKGTTGARPPHHSTR